MRSLRKFILAFALYVALALNGSLSFYLHQFFSWTSASNLLLPIGIMLIALFDDTNIKEVWLALGAGVVSDIYFFGIIGIYSICLPLVCWLLQKAARFIPEVFWARMLAVLIACVGINCFIWLILNVIGITRVSVLELLKGFLPTICWSIIFMSLTYKLWGYLATKYPFMVNLDNYR